MNQRRRIQRLRRRSGMDNSLLDRGWHSKAYHRHFEGYTEVETTNEKGKTVIQRVYVGDYYRLDLPKKKRVLLRLTYAALIGLIGVMFGLASSRPVGANMVWYMAIAQMLTLGGIGAMIIKLLSHATAPRDMTIGDWKASSKGLRKSAQFSAILLELDMFLTALYLLLKGENWGTHLLCIGLYALAGLVAMVVDRLEANAPYLTFPSTEAAPEDGSYIDV